MTLAQIHVYYLELADFGHNSKMKPNEVGAFKERIADAKRRFIEGLRAWLR